MQISLSSAAPEVLLKPLKMCLLPLLLGLFITVTGCKESSTPAGTSAHLVKAQSFIRNGQLSAARIEIMNALQTKPDDPAAYFILSEIYEDLGSFDESLKQLNRGLSLSKEQPKEKQLKKMWLELMTEPEADFNERLSSFSASNNAEKAELTYLEAFSLLKHGRESEVKPLLKQALDILPTHIDSLLFLARLSAKANDLDSAGNYVNDALNIDPTSVEALILKGKLALNQQDFALAEDSFTFALLEINKLDVMTPEKYTILSGLVLALNKLGQQEKAIQYSDILAQSRPGQLKSNYQGALSAISNRDVDKAQSELEKALKLAPTHAPSNYLMGMTKLRQGDLEAAEKYLSTALEGEYIPEKTRLALILTRLELKQLKEARLLIDTGLAETPDNPTYLSLMGTVLMLEDQTDESERSFKAALKHNKNYLPAINGLAKLYENMGKIDAAKTQLTIAANASPDNLQLFTQLIQFGTRNKQEQWALEEIKKLQMSAQNQLAPALVLAAYYLQKQDISQSQRYLDRAEVISPTNELVKRLSSSLHISKAGISAKQGKPKEALSQLNHAVSIQPSNLKAHMLKAGLLLEQGDTPAAIKVAESLQLDEKTRPVGLELEGNIWASVAQFEKAAQSYEQLWKTNKSGKLALKIYRIKKEFSDASTAMTHAKSWVEEQPEELSALITLAILEQENSNIKSAVALYEKVLSINNNSPLVLNNLSYIYFENGDPRALELAEEAYTLAPKSAAIADTYGWILVENKQLSKGLHILRQAAEAAPTTKEILQHYSEALTRAGKLDEAAAVMEKITEL